MQDFLACLHWKSKGERLGFIPKRHLCLTDRQGKLTTRKASSDGTGARQHRFYFLFFDFSRKPVRVKWSFYSLSWPSKCGYLCKAPGPLHLTSTTATLYLAQERDLSERQSELRGRKLPGWCLVHTCTHKQTKQGQRFIF